ncbi:MAG: hypothetical protein FWG91_01780 [Lachnospiraceae bacterium]|nr:hypothetical protein [Lachnospiraceae bacterium]
MDNIENSQNLYKDFLNLNYQELEALAINACEKEEREFYKSLCNFYLFINQPRVMKEKPF